MKAAWYERQGAANEVLKVGDMETHCRARARYVSGLLPLASIRATSKSARIPLALACPTPASFLTATAPAPGRLTR